MDSTVSALISSASSMIATSAATASAVSKENRSILLKVFGATAGIFILVAGYLGNIANVQQGLQSILSLWQSIYTWWSYKLPSYRVLQDMRKNDTSLVIFVRDFFIQPGTQLLSREGLNGNIGIVPNVLELWPRVEGIGLSNLLGAFGKLEKTEKIEIVEMGNDPGIWNKDLIVLGAQTQKCFDFYQKMQEVSYKVTGSEIIKVSTGKKIIRQNGYGYGIILKCKNPFVYDHRGIGILIGGFGVLGTEAATYYFSKHLADLGKQFGRRSFGIVVRASISGGAESVERITKYDTSF